MIARSRVMGALALAAVLAAGAASALVAGGGGEPAAGEQVRGRGRPERL